MSVYQVNKLLFRLKTADSVRALVSNEQALASQYKLSREEIEALKAEDYLRLNELGANPYLLRRVFRHKYPR